MQNPGEAARYLELALEEYQVEKDNYRMEAEITTRMADIYTKSREWLQAARANGIASRAYAMLADYENQVITTCHEAACLFRGNRPDLALQIADDCMLLCHKVQPSESISKWNFSVLCQRQTSYACIVKKSHGLNCISVFDTIWNQVTDALSYYEYIWIPIVHIPPQ